MIRAYYTLNWGSFVALIGQWAILQGTAHTRPITHADAKT
jgi:hypothetical protein